MFSRVKRWLWHLLTPTQIGILQRPSLLLTKPTIGQVNFGDLRRTTPIAAGWGLDRGHPVDRYYIENFLAANRQDIRGRVLEVESNRYTLRYGGDQVTQSEVLMPVAGHPGTTIVADLTSADHVPGDSFDCIILTQVLQNIYDYRAAIQTTKRLLRPSGVALITVAAMASLVYGEDGDFHDYWRWMRLALEKDFLAFFEAQKLKVEAWGNVLAVTAFLYGLGSGDLKREELDTNDPNCPLILTVRAVK
ncbi:MAG: methyltransferase domain-containing protein [Anaerolineae bacterium]